MSGRNGKRIRATFRERPVVLLTSVGPEEEHRWKDAVTTGAEIQSWLTDGAMQGLRPWFTKFNGTISDDRWVDPVVESFNLHAHLEPVLETMAPTAEIAILDPATTLRHHGQETREEAEANDLGFYHALVEAKLPFEMLSDLAMTPASLDRFKVVILANSTCLSDAQCQTLRDYVGRGGSIVAAFETATRDAENAPRNTLALGDLFGATMTGPSRGPLKNTYVALNGEHPIAAGFEGARRIIGGTRAIAVEATAGTTSAVPLRPGLSRSADGRSLPPRGAARPGGDRPRAPGRRPDRLHPLEHRRHLLGGAGRRPRPADRQRRALGARRPVPRRGHRTGRGRYRRPREPGTASPSRSSTSPTR